MDLGISEKIRPILEQVKTFIDEEILPLEKEYFDEIDVGDMHSGRIAPHRTTARGSRLVVAYVGHNSFCRITPGSSGLVAPQPA